MAVYNLITYTFKLTLLPQARICLTKHRNT
jgi:hypothetical protein